MKRPGRNMKVVLIAIFLLCRNIGLSQNVPAEHEIKVITKSYGDSIVIRWGPTTPVSWQLLNQYGYRIERTTVVRDSVVLRVDEKTILNSQPVKPLPLDAWKNDAIKDEIVAIAAQAIYGTSFQLTTARTTSLTDVVNKSRELESRFSFCLFSADLSRRAAELSGLKFTDKNPRQNEKYLYRVYSLVPENIQKINFGFAFQGTREKLILAAPRSPTVFPGDHAVRIEWDPNPQRTIYTAYYLEKSQDGGKTFLPVRNLPIVPVGTAESYNMVVLADSLADNDREYLYRIRGTNAFTDKGPYSQPVAVTGIANPKGNVSWGTNTVTPQNTIHLRWKFQTEWEKDIQGFGIERAPREGGPYMTLTPGPLEKHVREYEDKAPLPANYYRVATVGKSGKKLLSTPYLLQLEDSIPPASPHNVKARIDSIGIVRIDWKANEERDLFGYHVYRSNFRTSEFTRVTKAPLISNSFTDTLNIRTLTGNVYYKLIAVDGRFNPSPYSEVLELARPDITPPVAPVITAIKASKDGVHICWINSSSDDVTTHSIFRRDNGATAWALVRTFSKTDSTCFIDNPKTRNTYQYKIVAEDASKLATPSQTFYAKVLVSNSHPAIKGIKSLADRTNKQIKLTWEYNEAGVSKYLVYRSEDGAALSLYGSLPAGALGFTDGQLTLNTNYSYRVKAVFGDGLESEFGEEVKVQY